jgi:hypothetical protein
VFLYYRSRGASVPLDERTDLPDGLVRRPLPVTLHPGGFALLQIASSDVQTVGGRDSVTALRITPSAASGTVDVDTPGALICGRVLWVTPFTAFYDLEHPTRTHPPGWQVT